MRMNITDETTGEFVAWFDFDSAVRFREHTRWDGNNHISVNTGSQWTHEELYYTKSGRWVLESSSQYQGSLGSIHEINEVEAAKWLCLNECWDDDGMEKLPAKIREQVNAGMSALEI